MGQGIAVNSSFLVQTLPGAQLGLWNQPLYMVSGDLQAVIRKTKWLSLGKQGSCLDNGPKLVRGS